MRNALLAAGATLIAACGSANGSAPPAAGLAPTATPSPVASPIESPTPSAEPSPAPTPAPPTTMTVRFDQLPGGSHPVHLHAACVATQNFHLATVGDIAPDAAGGASITLTNDDFGRGWCLVVYTDASLTRVLTYRPI